MLIHNKTGALPDDIVQGKPSPSGGIEFPIVCLFSSMEILVNCYYFLWVQDFPRRNIISEEDSMHQWKSYLKENGS